MNTTWKINEKSRDERKTDNQSQKMEVHHHPEVEKKGFKEYLLEGLMIFLAVFMGFIAENIREHFANKEREKESIESLVRAITSDTLQLHEVIFTTTRSVTYIDCFIPRPLRQ